MIGARRGSPLAIGHGDGEMFFGSDAIALAPFTDRDHLSRGRRLGGADPRRRDDLRRDRRDGRAADGADASRRACWSTRATTAISWRRRSTSSRRSSATRSRTTSTSRTGRDGAARRFRRRLRRARPAVDHRLRHRLLRRPRRQILVRAVRAAAGRHRYRLRVPLPRAAAAPRAGCRSSSRSRARPPTRWPRCATPRAQGQKVAAIVNVRESTIAREADFVLPTLAGPEIGVASTKAFTCQLAVLGCARGRRRQGARASSRDATRRSWSARSAKCRA